MKKCRTGESRRGIFAFIAEKAFRINFFISSILKLRRNTVTEEHYDMDNNKNRMKDREKNAPELRRMKPGENADVGIVDGRKLGMHDGKHEKNGNS